MYTTLHKIVISVLFKKGLSRHFYVQMLKFSADAIRELYFDSARIVNAVDLIVNPNDYTAPIPCDYVDWTLVGFPIGQMIKPIYEIDTINSLPAQTSAGESTTYTTAGNNPSDPVWPGYWLFSNFNEVGENTGRRFGLSAADDTNGFRIFKERGIIQLTETYTHPTVRLEYISDGQCCDSASKVDPLAQAVIEAYMDWAFKQYAVKSSMGETTMAMDLLKREMRRYRARKSDLTITAVKQALYRSYKQAPKN